MKLIDKLVNLLTLLYKKKLFIYKSVNNLFF